MGPEPKRARIDLDTSDPDVVLQRKREIVEERIRERGLIPSIADLEACRRVGTYRLDLFNELAKELAGQLSQRLQDNRALKKELESLKGVQDRLQAANAKVAEKKKQLDRLVVTKQERDRARKVASEAEEEAKRLNTRVEQLTAANEAQEGKIFLVDKMEQESGL